MNCKNCNTLLNTKYKIFCNSSCSASYNNRIRKRNPWTFEQRKRVSQKLVEEIKNGTRLPPPKGKGRKSASWTPEQKKRHSEKFKALVKLGIIVPPKKTSKTKIIKHKKICLKCNCEFETASLRITTCRQCKYIKTQEKVCPICNTKFLTPSLSIRKFCSDTCYRKNHSIAMSERLKKNNYRYQLKGKDSYLEKSFEDWLKTLGIKKSLKGYLREIHFYNKNTKKHGYCDFIFPTIKTVIELDGTTHRKTIEKDKIRDEHLHSRGWKVLRLEHRKYVKKEYIKTITDVLKPVKRSYPDLNWDNQF